MGRTSPETEGRMTKMQHNLVVVILENEEEAKWKEERKDT